MKKVIIYMITLLLVILPTTQVSASSSLPLDDSYTINFVFTESFDELFGSSGDIFYRNAIGTNDNVTDITYNLILDSNNDNAGFVTARIDLLINNVPSYIIASGETQAMVLTNNKYWEGYLQGTLFIESKIHDDVNVYFSKLEHSDDINIGVSIFTDSGTTSFTFGDLIIDPQTFLEIESNINYGCGSEPRGTNIVESEDISTLSYQPIPDSLYQIVSNSFTHYSYKAMPAYYSQRARAYYDPYNNRLAVSLKTYADYLTSYSIENSEYYGAYYTTGIKSMNISLLRLSAETYISNIQNPGIIIGGVNNVNLNLYSLFFNALSDFGVPTNIIQMHLGTQYGSFSNSTYSDSVSITMQSASDDFFNYDNIEYGVPIVHQLDTATSSNGTYLYSTSVVYKIRCIRPIYDDATNLIMGYLPIVTEYNAGVTGSTVTVYVQ